MDESDKTVIGHTHGNFTDRINVPLDYHGIILTRTAPIGKAGLYRWKVVEYNRSTAGMVAFCNHPARVV